MSLPALKDNKLEPGLFDMGAESGDLGSPDSLRYNILSWVLEERYDRAIEEIKDFMERPSEYPNFKSRTTRYLNHAIDLIYAIKAKRSFPGINSLTRAKQQELREKFKEHFRELRYILKTVEDVHTDLRIQDVRSTIYVVRAVWIAVIAILVTAFAMEIFHGLAKTGALVFDDLFGELANWLAERIGF